MSEGGEKRLFEQSKTKRFERIVAPHIAAAYNLARWLLQNDQDAEDVVQETCLLAYKHLDFLRGEEARAWLLKIARNESYDWLRRNKPMALNVSLDERNIELSCESHNPEQLAMLASGIGKPSIGISRDSCPERVGRIQLQRDRRDD